MCPTAALVVVISAPHASASTLISPHTEQHRHCRGTPHTTGSDSGWQGAGPCLQLLLCPCLRPGPLRGPAAGLQAWRSRENLAPASWPHAPRFYLESGPLAGSQRQHWGEALGLGPVQVKQRQGRAEAGVCNAAELRGACGEGPGGLG